jgi:hypothetical protein
MTPTEPLPYGPNQGCRPSVAIFGIPGMNRILSVNKSVVSNDAVDEPWQHSLSVAAACEGGLRECTISTCYTCHQGTSRATVPSVSLELQFWAWELLLGHRLVDCLQVSAEGVSRCWWCRLLIPLTKQSDTLMNRTKIESRKRCRSHTLNVGVGFFGPSLLLDKSPHGQP